MGRNLSLQTRRRNARGINKRVQSAWRGRRFFGLGNRASLVVNSTGNDNDFFVFARTPGTAGNSIRVRIVVAGNNTPLSVTAAGNDITINSATSGGGAATSTAKQVIAAINNSTTARGLIWASAQKDNAGDGTVAALAYTNLAGAA